MKQNTIIETAAIITLLVHAAKFIDKVINGNYKVPKIVDQLKINKDCRFIDEI